MGSDGTVLFLDCGGGYTTMRLSKRDCTLNRVHFTVCKLYLKNEKKKEMENKANAQRYGT